MFDINKRICPKCGEKIEKSAKKCPFCKEDVEIEVKPKKALNRDTKLIIKCVIASVFVVVFVLFVNHQFQMMRYKKLMAKAQEQINNKYDCTIEEAVLGINTLWGTHFSLKEAKKQHMVSAKDGKMSDVENYVTDSPKYYKKIAEHEYQCLETEYVKGNITFRFMGDKVKFEDSVTGDVEFYKLIDGKLAK